MNAKDLLTGVKLVERLLEAADGGREFCIGEYHASTILAMFENSAFRNRVLAGHSAMPPAFFNDPNNG